MTGFYRIHPNAAQKADLIKASLKRDHLDYQESTEDSWLVIRVSGTPKIPKRKPSPIKIMPDPPSVEQCAKRARAAENALREYRATIPSRLREATEDQWWYYQTRDVEKRRKQRRIGRAITIIIARHRNRQPYRLSKQDYSELDAACGHRVKRESQLPKRFTYLLEWIVRFEAFGTWEKYKPETPEIPEPRVSSIQTYMEMRLEMEYWQEMERLAS